jgi:hypothetical protein
MTTGVEVHVPARVRTDPTALAADGGAQVEEALAAAAERALDKSVELVQDQHGDAGKVVVHAPVVTWTGPGLASVAPSTRARVEDRLTRALARKVTRVESPPKGPPRDKRRKSAAWRVLKTVGFRARVSALTRLIEELGGDRGLSALHAERAYEERPATLRVIEALRVVSLEQVIAEVERSLPRRPGEQLMYGYTVYPGDRHRLVFLDARGMLSRELPDLTGNFARAVETPTGVVLGPGALIALVSFSLPAVVAEGRLGVAPESEISVPLRELDFLIESASFETAFGVSWQRYAEEFGEFPRPLRIQAFFTKAAIHYDTLDQLVRAAVRSERVPSGSWFFGALLLLTEERMAGLPDAARAELTPYARSGTRSLSPERERGTWGPDWDGAFLYAVLTPDRSESEQARGRGLARERADTLIGLLQRDRNELLWPYEILTFLRRHYRRAEPRQFEYLLRELEEREGGFWFTALFDWVEVEENGDLHWYLIDLAARTAYAGHARVTATKDLFNKRRRGYLPHLYFADRREIWLDRSPGRVLKQLGLAYDIDSDYRVDRTENVLKPEREAKLIEQVQKVAPQFIEDIFTGKKTAEFDDADALLKAIVTEAAGQIGIGEDDYYEKVTQRTLRLLDVERRLDPYERYLITYRFEERVVGDERGWQPVPGSQRTESDVDFQWLLWGWEYHHEAARMETFAIVVLGLTGAVALAPVLVPAAGGWKVVLISIALSEAFYVGSTLWKGKEFTAEGFVLAAVDGYIGALGFRAGSIPAQFVARKIGGEATRRIVVGWIAEKAVASMIGGAGSAATMQFTHDLVNIAVRGGKFSSPEEYVRSMSIGLLLGFAFEAGASALRPVLRAVRSPAAAAAAFNTTDDVARAAQQAGLSAADWDRIIAETLAAVEPKLAGTFKAETARRLTRGIGARLREVSEHLAGAPVRLPAEFRRAFLERALEVSGVQVSRAAAPGLLRYARLSRDVVDQEAAFALLRRLRESGETDSFFRALAAIDDQTAAGLVRRGELESLVSSAPALDPLARSRAFLENVGRAPPKAPVSGPGGGPAAGDIVMHPRYQNVLLDAALGADGFEALLKELRRTPEGEQIAQAIVDGRLHVIVHPEEIFAGYSGTQVGNEIFAQWTGSIEDTASTLLHEGSHWLDPNRFVPGVKQTGAGTTRLLLEATARANEFQLRRLQGLAPQDAVEAAYRSEYDRVLAATGSEFAANRAADQAIIDGLRKDPVHYGVETAAQEQRRLAAAVAQLDETLETSLAGVKPPPAPSKGLPSRAELQAQLNAIEWRFAAEVERSGSALKLYDELDEVRSLVEKGNLADARARVAQLSEKWRAEAELVRVRLGFETKFAPPGSAEAAAALPVRTGVGGKKSIEGLREPPTLAPDAPALPLDQVQVTHRPFSSVDDVNRQAAILELHKLDPSKAGLEYERFIIEREGPPGINLDRPGRRPDIGGTEITLVGMEGGLSAHKRQQLWLDLVDTRRIHLIVPQASDLALFEIAQLGRAAEDLLGVSVVIEVVVTK